MGFRIERIWQARGAVARAASGGLLPLSWGLGGVMALRSRLVSVRKVERPVISVGNLSVGGNGKTPLVLELCRRLREAGRRPVIVSRGYGRSQADVIRHWSPGDAPADVRLFGDEAAWFTLRGPEVPVVVGADRVAACRRAIEALDAQVMVLDDAFQHIRLARDLDLVAVHARAGFGNGRLLPAGPLREPLSALGRAQGLIFTYSESGEDAQALTERHGLANGQVTALCRMRPAGFSRGRSLEAASDCPQKVWSLCGIARPEGFVRSVTEAGLDLLGADSLGDHARLSVRRLRQVNDRARAAGAQAILCTEKDLIKWPESDKGMLPALALRLDLEWLDDGARVIDELLEAVL